MSSLAGRKIILFMVVVCIGVGTIMAYRYLTVERGFDGSMRGEVRGELAVVGNITTNQTFEDQPFLLWVYDLNGNNTSYFRLRIWNISELFVRDENHGIVTNRTFEMSGRELTAEAEGTYLTCMLKTARLKVNYTSYHAIDNDGYFDMVYPYDSLSCTGELAHQSGEYLDFQISNKLTLRIGNETMTTHLSRLAFPGHENARFEMTAMGRGVIKPTPTFTVNGSLRVEDFIEVDGDGDRVRRIGRLDLISDNITIATVQEPYCDATHENYYYTVSWIIEIKTETYEFRIY